MKKSTSTFRVCENRLTPIQWDSQLFFNGQWTTPPKKKQVKVYSTKSLGKIENLKYMITNTMLKQKSYGKK